MTAALVALLWGIALTPSASAVTRTKAAAIAVKALGSKARKGPLIVFAAGPARPGAVVSDAGTSRPIGITSSTTLRTVARGSRRERSFVFYEDRAPYRTYGHSGRVALVGVDSGRVRLSSPLRWAPLIDGALPRFLRTAAGYESDRVYVADPTRSLPRASSPSGVFDTALTPGDAGAQMRAQQALAAEASCAVGIGGQAIDLGDSYSITTLLRALAGTGGALLPAVQYPSASATSPTAFVEQQMLQKRSCRDVLIWLAGGAWRTASQPTVRVSARLVRSRLSQRVVTASALRRLFRTHPTTTFKLMVDARSSGGWVSALQREPNVLLITTAATEQRSGLRRLPSLTRLRAVSLPGYAAPGYTSSELTGARRFLDSAAEVDFAIAEQRAGRSPSFLAWMLARAFQLGSPEFVNAVGRPRGLFTRFTASGPPEAGGGSQPNRAPAAADDAVTTAKKTGVSVPVLANDSDPDSDPLTVATVTTTGTKGTVTIASDRRSVRYDPGSAFASLGTGETAADTFTYAISDGRGGSASAKVTVTLTGANDSPAVNDDAATTDEHSTKTVSVLANDSDPNGDTLSVGSIDISSTTGAASISGGSTTVTYDPNGKFTALGVGATATDHVGYTAQDGHGGSATATLTVTVTGLNDGPDAVDDTASVGQDQTINQTAPGLLANDTDP
ncbi:MAG: hypothetical protein QOG41_268, partial [Thermoleophilaceae bacterium]|nr:hypothetical protein [Thermoleophilaceae bacterium]